MKNIFYLLLGCLFFFACKDPDADIYEGDTMLNFNKGVNGNGFVLNSQTYSDYKISYGSLKAVQSNHSVKLVFDASNSTAVQGTDFEILNNATDDLSAGETGGEFTIRIYKAPAVQSGKTAVFKLQSASLMNAGFDQTYTLNMSLTCPVSSFVGNFTNTATWWNSGPGGAYEIVENPAVANQLLVKDFWDVGIDLVLNYNPTTYVVSVPDQNTGYFVSQYNGYIFAKPSTDATQISIFNPCTRQMTLYINYYIPSVGSYGNQTEKFVGF